MRIFEVAHHRNGICGAGFYVVRFAARPELANGLAIVFPEYDSNGEMDSAATVRACRVAVLDPMKAATGDVASGGGNSWRGDHYAEALVAAIEAWEAQRTAEMSAPA